MVRSIFLLGVVGLILVGAGILHVNWNKDTNSASFSFDKDKAKQAAVKVLDEAKVLEASLESGSQATTK